MTYDPYTVFNTLDNNIVGFLLIGGTALIFNYIYFYGAAKSAAKDKVFTFPLFCTTVWFGHDFTYLWYYDLWFNVYDHWYVKLFWLGLIPTCLAELGYIYQTWKYGRQEILTKASNLMYNFYFLGAIAGGVIGWWSFKIFLDDPIYAYTFGSSGFIAPFFVLGRIIQRGDTKGQSVLTWGAYCGMQIFWFAGAMTFFGPIFRSPSYLIMAATSVIAGIILTITCYRMNKVENGCPVTG